jgi:nitrogen fixation protein NifU and related proteins
MSNSRALYEQVILDHAKNPRNCKALKCCDHSADGYNPLCGDQFTVYLNIEDDIILDISFDGNGCAISKASASMMTAQLKGKTLEDAKELFKHFHTMVTSPPESPVEDAEVGKLKVFSGVRDFPVRIKCATLAWHTLNAAIEGREDTVSTD